MIVSVFREKYTYRSKWLILAVVAFFIGMTSCNTSTTTKDKSITEDLKGIERQPEKLIGQGEQQVAVYRYEQFKKFLEAENDTTYVVNFWATWCKPCVEELPYFETLYANYKEQNVRLILVSLDFEKQLETKLLPFIKKHQLQGEVLVLSQKGMSNWIDKIDPSWSGALPATIIYNKDKHAFFEQSFEYEGLENKLKDFLEPTSY